MLGSCRLFPQICFPRAVLASCFPRSDCQVQRHEFTSRKRQATGHRPEATGYKSHYHKPQAASCSSKQHVTSTGRVTAGAGSHGSTWEDRMKSVNASVAADLCI